MAAVLDKTKYKIGDQTEQSATIEYVYGVEPDLIVYGTTIQGKRKIGWEVVPGKEPEQPTASAGNSNASGNSPSPPAEAS